jgi:UDP-2,4-diacetamido-2,4,6-trideoxy-beta-L-altropyranose hydrolase
MFRVDASDRVGTGHVIRCLTLANTLREAGAEIIFSCRDYPGNLIELVRKHEIKTIVLPTEGVEDARASIDFCVWDESHQLQDAQETISGLGGVRPEWIVVDHYALDHIWESQVRNHCGRLMVIDDLADRAHNCDCLLDQNLYTDAGKRYLGMLPGECIEMLEPKYALLQPEYSELHKKSMPRNGHVKNVLIYFGGADPDNLTGQCLDVLSHIGAKGLNFHVVIGASNVRRNELIELASEIEGAVVHEKLDSLAQLMVMADLAIGASGATTWERCCLGLPSVVISTGGNQKLVAKELHDRGFIKWMGHADSVNYGEMRELLHEIFSIGLPEGWASNCYDLVDGMGAQRVASVMMASSNTDLILRRADIGDEGLLLYWVNDPIVRANAFSCGHIDPAGHHKWFRECLKASDRCQIYIAEDYYHVPVGQVRFDKKGDEWYIDYSIDLMYRGCGLGKVMLEAAMNKFMNERENVVFIGEVKKSNKASCDIFDSIRVFSRSDCNEVITYRSDRLQ